MKGKYIVIEGADATGKTTLLTNLLQRLGRAIVLSEPSDVLTGEVIRYRLQDPNVSARELAYLFAADRIRLKKRISEYLNAGINVLSSRGILSSIIYQGKEIGYDHVARLNCDALVPDATVVLFSSEKVLEERLGARENLDVLEQKDQKRVRDLYKDRDLHKKYSPWLGTVYLVDASASPEKVADTVEEIINSKFGW